MEANEARKKAIISILKNIEGNTLVNIWNNYCREENMDDYIYENEDSELNMLFDGNIGDALRAACYGEYQYTDPYVIINAYGNLTSFTDYDVPQHIDFDTLADYIMDNGCDEISEVWMEDLTYDFVQWFNDTHNPEITEETDFSPYNLVTEDWDDIADDIFENE